MNNRGQEQALLILIDNLACGSDRHALTHSKSEKTEIL